MILPSELEISSSYNEVRRAAGWLRDQVATVLDTVRADDLELAAVEALTNVVRHAYFDRAGCPIKLSLQQSPGKLDLVIRDHGVAPPDDLLTRTQPDFDDVVEEAPETGSGLILIHSCVDEVAIHRSGDENTLELTIYLPASTS